MEKLSFLRGRLVSSRLAPRQERISKDTTLDSAIPSLEKAILRLWPGLQLLRPSPCLSSLVEMPAVFCRGGKRQQGCPVKSRAQCDCPAGDRKRLLIAPEDRVGEKRLGQLRERSDILWKEIQAKAQKVGSPWNYSFCMNHFHFMTINR